MTARSSPEETYRLIAAAQAGDDAAMAQLVRENMGLVYRHARRRDRPELGREVEDAIQDGVMGLMHAIRRFDLSRGLRLSTYADTWIRQRIGCAERDTGSLVRVAAAAHQKGVRTWAASLDAPAMAGEPDGPTVGDRLADTRPSPEDAVLATEEGGRLESVLSGLSPRLALVLRRRAKGLSLEAVGAELGVSKERARQLEAEALAAAKRAARAIRHRQRLTREYRPGSRLSRGLRGRGAIAALKWRAREALLRGESIRRVRDLTGLSLATITALRKEIRASTATPILCACGQDASHRGWCAVRFAKSPKRQAFMAGWHGRGTWMASEEVA